MTRSVRLLLAMSLIPAAAAAQERIPLTRLPEPIRLDGLVDDAAWEAVPPLAVDATRPVAGAPPSEPTELRIAYDERFLYLSGRFQDGEPSAIQTRSLERDGASLAEDRVVLLLDTFDDNQSAVVFVLTAAGARTDYTLVGDGLSGEGGQNRGWNAVWDGAVERSAEGWSAELRIPFASLGFQDVDGRVHMGLIAYRDVPRKAETVAFPSLPHEWILRPSKAADVRLDGVYGARPLYVTPYALGGMRQEPSAEDVTREVGLDVKYGLTPSLTLDLTLNTDFAQVEADAAVVNLSRFALFLPEKRRFFLERSGVFDFSLGMMDRAFHSRVIGLGEEGVPQRILGGARLVGRVGAWDVVALDMQTSPDGAPGENFGVLRVRRAALNASSWVGGILTTRASTEGVDALVGADASLRLRQDDDLRLVAAQRIAPGVGGIDAARLWAGYSRYAPEGLGFEGNVIWAGPEHEPPVGFAARKGFTQLQGWSTWGFRPGSGSAIRRWGPNAWGSVFLDEAGGFESLNMGVNAELQTRAGTSAWAWVSLNREDLDEGFDLPGDAVVAVGRHEWVSAGLNWQMPPGRLLRAGVWLMGGGFYDGTRITAGISPEWSLSPRLSLGGRVERNRVRFPGREGFDADILEVRAQAAATARLSAGGAIQYSSAAESLSGNVRVRWSFGEGRDLYLVYDEALDTGLERDSLLPPSERRTLLLKYAYTFTW